MIFQADLYPHARTKSIKSGILVERCRVWNMPCGHVERVVPKVQTPAHLPGTKEPEKSNNPVSGLVQGLRLCHLKFLALGVSSLISDCHLPSQESTAALSCVSHSQVLVYLAN